MKVSVNKSILETILINVQPYLEKRDLSQITSHVNIEVKDNKLFIKASDFEIGLNYFTSHVNIHSTGNATANGKKLLDIIKGLKNEDIILESIENYLFIKQNNSKFKLPMFNHEEFPKFPTIDEKAKFEINSINLIQAIKKISPAIDSNNPKFELNGALIDIKQDLINIVSTDTKRLALDKINIPSLNELKIIIPKKAILEMQKLFLDDIEIFYDENIFIAKSNNFIFFTKLINGKFPSYEHIIPKEEKYNLILNREKMIEAIKQIAIISNEIKIIFKQNSIIFESLNDDNIEAKTEIEYNTNLNKEIYIATYSKSLLDFISQIDQSSFTLGINESNLPFILKNENFITVIMPILI